jgi:enamine deaminase RidA (YjgF/YER057c/UK114 family)
MYLSGQDPILENGDLACGIVGRDFNLEQANGHAIRTGLVLLSGARSILDSLDRVGHVLNVFSIVNAAADFIENLKVINGCPDLMVEVFSKAGRHARAAVGMWTLPGRISVEIAAILAVKS